MGRKGTSFTAKMSFEGKKPDGTSWREDGIKFDASSSGGGSSDCADSAKSGFVHRDTLVPFTCRQLTKYCTHKKVGPKLRINCRHTCGTCNEAGQDGWIRKPKTHCAGNTLSGSYRTLKKAKAACQADDNCEGVYDPHCDNKGTFRKCNDKALAKSSYSCVYIEPDGVHGH